ncbi:MAG: phage holin family protein [Bacteroidota bacterium]
MTEETTKTTIGTIFDSTGDYLETRLELLKLKAINKSSKVGSDILTKLLIVLLIAFAIFMLNIGVAMWIGYELGKLYYGFFIVAGFYALVSLILFGFRKQLLKTPLNNLFIKMMAD